MTKSFRSTSKVLSQINKVHKILMRYNTKLKNRLNKVSKKRFKVKKRKLKMPWKENKLVLCNNNHKLVNNKFLKKALEVEMSSASKCQLTTLSNKLKRLESMLPILYLIPQQRKIKWTNRIILSNKIILKNKRMSGNFKNI